MKAKEYYDSTRLIETNNWTLGMVMNFAEEYHDACQTNTQLQLYIVDAMTYEKLLIFDINSSKLGIKNKLIDYLKDKFDEDYTDEILIEILDKCDLILTDGIDEYDIYSDYECGDSACGIALLNEDENKIFQIK